MAKVEEVVIIVLDHHKTAQQDLAGEWPENVSIVFNMDKCGAMYYQIIYWTKVKV